MKILISGLLIVISTYSYSQNVVYSHQGDFNSEGTSFGLKITSSSSEAGHTHHGDYLISLSSRKGDELYYFHLNSEYNGIYNYAIERLAGQTNSDDVVLLENSSTSFNMEIRFHGVQNDWHKITVHELAPPRGGDISFEYVEPSQFQSGGNNISLITNSGLTKIRSSPTLESSTDPIEANLVIESSSNIRSVSEGAAIGFSLPSSSGSNSRWLQGRVLVTPDNEDDGRADGRMYLQTRYYNGAWDWKNNLVLFPNGYVGIGTETPTSLLSVAGTIDAKEIKVETDAGSVPDYVFASDYQLTTLEETASYIKENHHLPEVPSAKEMEAEGVNLGEMNMLLLKKIEELTLHLIEKDEQYKDQQEINELLLERIEKLENK